ncbi:MAG: hypothetical protein HY692_01425, partial [Cyanobacteria bacterium NC_groundwater_1444_Ag_S-0.65um_54_12]|nr:hypothetical protein [Cyanobacteria bacterium NC_groundwater_1444_Ag_S-0.65um_54_12]
MPFAALRPYGLPLSAAALSLGCTISALAPGLGSSSHLSKPLVAKSTIPLINLSSTVPPPIPLPGPSSELPANSPEPTTTAWPSSPPASASRQLTLFRALAFAGAASGSSGNAGDGGTLASALFAGPAGLARQTNEVIFVADYQNHQVRRIASGSIATVAGWGALGFAGDGGPARDAQLNHPFGIAIAGDGTLAIADYGNNRVRAIDRQGNIGTIAGGGSASPSAGLTATAAALVGPAGVAYDVAGNLYIAEFLGHRALRIDQSGNLTVLAGNGTPGSNGDGGPAIAAQLNQPVAILPDERGGCWIADYGNHRIRYLDSQGTIHTFAGTGTPGSNGDGGPANSALLQGPAALALLADRTLLVADA